MYLPFTKYSQALQQEMLPAQLSVIVNGCQNNHRESQRLLFEWLKSFAVNICRRYATNITEAEDLVSDGFMKVYRNIGQYNGQYGFTEAAFKGWFKRVIINNCINYLRQHERIAGVSDEKELIDTPATDQPDVIEAISYKELFGSVMQLPSSYKMVFCLFAIDGYSHEEIAKTLNISVGTSKSNLFKARQHLKKRLATQTKQTNERI